MAKQSKKRKKSRPRPARLHLGERLRKLRAARGLTLQQLSGLAGVSKAMLSQIEQEKVNPTVAVILRVIPAADVHYTFRSDPLCSIRTLSPLTLEKDIEFYRLTLASGGELASEPHFPGAEEFLHLTRGRLAVTSGRQTVQLACGDSIHYRGDVPHALRNTGRGQAEAYLIVRYRGE